MTSSVDTAARSEEGRAVAAGGALNLPGFVFSTRYIYICFSPPSFCFVYRGSKLCPAMARWGKTFLVVYKLQRMGKTRHLSDG